MSSEPVEGIAPVVRTACGLVRGFGDGRGGAVFAGIPFAAAPIGSLRLRSPAPPPAWDGIRDASRFPARPAQPSWSVPPEHRERAASSPLGALLTGLDDDAETSEDCLYLNVWTPDPGGNLPVVVWVYGGGFQTGTASPPGFDGAALSRVLGAVVVAANYRVGALGWLFPGGVPGGPEGCANLGLQDQVAALRWVADNIAGFGGDPGSVVLAGQSAGAFSVATLLSVPATAGLVHRAVLMSGSVGRARSAATGAVIARDLLATVGARTWDDLADVPLDRLLTAQQAVVDTDQGTGWLPGGRCWGPVVDGAVLPRDPLEAFADGSLARVPLLVGANRDEFTLLALASGDAYRPDDEAAVRAEAARAGADDPDGLVAAYRVRAKEAGSADDDLGAIRTMLLSDAVYRIPAARLVRAHTAAGGRAYSYLFAGEPFGPGLGAFHGAEAFYLFDRLTSLAAAGLDTEAHRALRETVTTACARFVATGDPGWPAWTPVDNAQTRQLGAEDTFVTEPPPDTAPHWFPGKPYGGEPPHR